MDSNAKIVARLGLLAAAMALTGCLSNGEVADVGAVAAPPAVNPNPGTNSAPAISGSPAGSVLVGDSYQFTPNATDTDGDDLVFSIQNQPPWASFDSSSGRMSGVAEAGSEGLYTGIRIGVSDGNVTVFLDPFSVEVVQTATGTATLSWDAPTTNEDGTTLDNLAGFRVYYGTAPGDYTQSTTIGNPGITTYVVENLTPNTWYFATTAYNTRGIESDFSNEVSKVLP